MFKLEVYYLQVNTNGNCKPIKHSVLKKQCIHCCWQPSVMFDNGDCALVESFLNTAYPVPVKSDP